MDNIMQMQVFFFISSIGFVIMGILGVIVLIYIIQAVTLFSKILKRAEKDIDSIGDTTKEMLEDLRDSMVYKFLFKHKKQKSK